MIEVGVWSTVSRWIVVVVAIVFPIVVVVSIMIVAVAVAVVIAVIPIVVAISISIIVMMDHMLIPIALITIAIAMYIATPTPALVGVSTCVRIELLRGWISVRGAFGMRHEIFTLIHVSIDRLYRIRILSIRYCKLLYRYVYSMIGLGALGT